MPIYEPEYVEYSITSGHIRIAMEDGRQLPAYWAHPVLGTKFPGIAIIHDWWGMTDMIRHMAHLFAQMGHYVMVPDLFNGQVAQNASEALELFEQTKERNYQRVDDALRVLEHHHHCNKSVAAIGVGMGGSLAFEASISRDDLEAAVAFGGFPQRYLGQFANAHAPICAFFGEKEQHIPATVIKQMRAEMVGNAKGLQHEIHIMPELGHDLFSDGLNDSQRQRSREVLKLTFGFLDKYLEGPQRPGDRYVY